jgi:MFS family permease
MLIVLQALHGAAGALFNPAATGLVPQTVSPGRLQQANALLSLTASGATIAGPAAAGLLLAFLDPGWVIAVDASTFALSALFLARLRVSATPAAPARFLADLSAGWREVRSRRWVWTSIIAFMAVQFLALPAFLVLGPLVADEDLGGATDWAAIMALVGVGAVVGDLVALRWRPARPLLAAFCVLLLGTPVLPALGVAAPVALLAALGGLWGLSVSISNTFWYTTLQEGVPQHALSRVASYDWLGSTVLRPLGFVLVGPVADVAGVSETLIAAGALTFAAYVGVLLVRDVRDVRSQADGAAGYVIGQSNPRNDR